MKGSGDIIGLTEKPAAFRWWMLSGPEIARLLKQFEENTFLMTTQRSRRTSSTMNRVSQQRRQLVNSLSETIRQMGNPFLDNFPNLVTLESHYCIDESVVSTLHTLEETVLEIREECA